MVQTTSPKGPSVDGLKGRFAAGRIPSEDDFLELIDAAYVGWRAVSSPATDSGLKLEDGVLNVVHGDGIDVDDNGISVRTGDGLGKADGAICIKVAPGGGLKAPPEGLAINTGPGVTTTEEGITINYGAGLQILDRKLSIKAGSGFTVDGGALNLEPVLLGTSSLFEIIRSMTPAQKREIFFALSHDARDTELEEKMNIINEKATDGFGSIEDYGDGTNYELEMSMADLIAYLKRNLKDIAELSIVKPVQTGRLLR